MSQLYIESVFKIIRITAAQPPRNSRPGFWLAQRTVAATPDVNKWRSRSLLRLTAPRKKKPIIHQINSKRPHTHWKVWMNYFSLWEWFGFNIIQYNLAKRSDNPIVFVLTLKSLGEALPPTREGLLLLSIVSKRNFFYLPSIDVHKEYVSEARR